MHFPSTQLLWCLCPFSGGMGPGGEMRDEGEESLLWSHSVLELLCEPKHICRWAGSARAGDVIASPCRSPPSTAHTVSLSGSWSTHHLAYGRVGEKIKPFPLISTKHDSRVATHTVSLWYGPSVVLEWRVRVQLAPLSTLWKGHLEVP